MNKKLMKI